MVNIKTGEKPVLSIIWWIIITRVVIIRIVVRSIIAIEKWSD